MQTVPWEKLPERALTNRILSLSGEQGSIELYAPLPVVVSRVSGHMSEAFADAWITATRPLFAKGQPHEYFNDWALMSGYDSAARKKLTDWSLQQRSLITRSVFTTNSRMVSMGVAVAGSALALASIRLESLPRAEFTARLTKLLAEAPRARDRQG
jgi:hypothetical protein